MTHQLGLLIKSWIMRRTDRRRNICSRTNHFWGGNYATNKYWWNVWHICQYHPFLCITHMLIRILKGPMWWPSLESAHLTNHRKKRPACMVWLRKVSILRNPPVTLARTGASETKFCLLWRNDQKWFLLCCARQARTLNRSCDLCPQVLLAALGAPERGEKILELVLTTLRPHKSLEGEMRGRKIGCWRTFRAWSIIPVKSSYSAGVRW